MEKNLEKNVCPYISLSMYNWIALQYTWKIVNQLYFNLKIYVYKLLILYVK